MFRKMYWMFLWNNWIEIEIREEGRGTIAVEIKLRFIALYNEEDTIRMREKKVDRRDDI
jgi:hypothetical protein